MSKYYYDLHTHSCLSPCADDDNTPNNLLGMATLSGIDILALTDHNTTKNCPAFFEAAERYSVIPVAGMELTTSEDIHVVCLFETLESAMKFDEYIDSFRVKIENRTSIFGKQLITDKDDNIISEERYLLSNATNISIEEIASVVSMHDGICYPAHIDRDANGIISTLGTFPTALPFSCVEFHNPDSIKEISEKYNLCDKLFILSSDAHYLADIRDKEFYFELDTDSKDGAIVRKKLFEKLRQTI